MSIYLINDWEFETLDYTKYIHIVNQEKIIWFATNYNLYSNYLRPSKRTLHLISFSSKSISVNGQEIISVLIYSRYRSGLYYLELFTESEKNWKVFNNIFDFIINPDLEINMNFRKNISEFNQLKSTCQINIKDE